MRALCLSGKMAITSPTSSSAYRERARRGEFLNCHADFENPTVVDRRLEAGGRQTRDVRY